MKRITRTSLLSAVSAIVVLAGCAIIEPPIVTETPGRLPRAVLAQLAPGMTTAEVESAAGRPAGTRGPSRIEVHRMLQGPEWDTAYIYHGELVPGRFVRNSCQIFFKADHLVAWSFPYITKDQYVQMTKRVPPGTLTMSAIEREWGYASALARTQVGVDARYHLLQPDGTWYRDAIIIRTNGDQVILITLANF